MKKIIQNILSILLLLLANQIAFGQPPCPWGGFDNIWLDASSTQHSGVVNLFPDPKETVGMVVLAGETYQVSSCGETTGVDTQITIFEYDQSTVIVAEDDDATCGGLDFDVTFVAPYTGTVYLQFQVYESSTHCSSCAVSCAHEATAECLTCPSTATDPATPSLGSNPVASNTCDEAPLVQNLDGYGGTTSSAYTIDAPGDLSSEFCGLINNNSFIRFIASATTAEFEFWVPSGSDCLTGLQFAVFGVTNPCDDVASDWTSVSNGCVGLTGSIGSYGHFVAEPLTIGETYYVMFDGFGGDVCDYVMRAVSGVTQCPLEPGVASQVCSADGTSYTVEIPFTGGNTGETYIITGGANTGDDPTSTAAGTMIFGPFASGAGYSINVSSVSGICDYNFEVPAYTCPDYCLASPSAPDDATINCGDDFQLSAIPGNPIYEAVQTQCGLVSMDAPTVLASGGTAQVSVDIGTSLDDAIWEDLPIGFSFDFYGVSYSVLDIQTNGLLMFGGTETYTGFSGVTIPDTGAPNDFIAGLFADWDARCGGTISYQTVGTAPNRQFVAMWEDIEPYCSGTTCAGTCGGTSTFQIVLNEGSNEIQTIIETFPSDHDPSASDPNATQGIEANGGTVAFATPGRNDEDFTGIDPTDLDCTTFREVPVTCSFVDWRDSGGNLVSTNETHTVTGLLATETFTGTWNCNGKPCPDDVVVTVDPACPTCDDIALQASATPSSIALGGSSTIAATWTDSGSGYTTSTGTCAYIAPTATDYTDHGGGDDTDLGSATLPFAFEFYGASVTDFNINSNGTIQFGSTSSTTGNQNMPSTTTPNNLIAGMWDDLVATQVQTYTSGTAPNRIFVLDYVGYHFSTTSEVVEFQILLEETTNVIHINCIRCDKDASDPSSTQGIENADGTQAIQTNYGDWSELDVCHTFTPVTSTTFVGWSTADANGAPTTESGIVTPAVLPATYTVTVTLAEGTQCTADVTITDACASANLQATASPTTITSTGGTADIEATWTETLVPTDDYVITTSTCAYIAPTATDYTNHGGGDDINLGNAVLPFPFKFFNVDVADFNINSNGTIQFGSTSSTTGNQNMPSTTTPNNLIAGMWDDLVATQVQTYTSGTAPNRIFVLDYVGYHFSTTSEVVEFQILLEETTNVIHINCIRCDKDASDPTATQGIENAAGDKAFQTNYGDWSELDVCHTFTPDGTSNVTFDGWSTADANGAPATAAGTVTPDALPATYTVTVTVDGATQCTASVTIAAGPCNCDDPGSNCGSSYPDKCSAGVGNDNGFPGVAPCEDILAFGYTTTDGQVYEFCLDYTTGPQETQIGTAFFDYAEQCPVTRSINIYAFGTCNAPLLTEADENGTESIGTFFPETAHLFTVTPSTAYTICWTEDYDETSCSGIGIAAVCPMVYDATVPPCPLVEGGFSPCGNNGDNEYVIMTNNTGAILDPADIVLGVLEEDAGAGNGFDGNGNCLYDFNYAWTQSGSLPGGLDENIGTLNQYSILADGATVGECSSTDCSPAAACTTAELINDLNTYTLGYPACAPVFAAPPAGGIPDGAMFVIFQGAGTTSGTTLGFDYIQANLDFSAYCGQTIYAFFGDGTASGFVDNSLLRAYYISLDGGAHESIIPVDGDGLSATVDCSSTITPLACATVELASTKVDGTIIDNDTNGVLSDGDEITYTVEVTNNGTGYAYQVNFVDDPSVTDANMSFSGIVSNVYSGSDSPTITDNSTATQADVCISSIAPGETLTVTFTALYTAPAVPPTEVCNQGTVTYPDPGDASAPFTALSFATDDPDDATSTTDPTCTPLCAIIIVDAVPTNATCELDNGSIATTVTGGATPLTFDWDDDGTGDNDDTEDRTGLAPGVYNVTVTDANNCTGTATATITNVGTPNTGTETYTGCEGDGYSVLVGATTYDESNPSGTETLTNAAGCDSVVTVTLTFNAPSTGDETYTGCEGDGYSVLVGATTYDEANPSGTETLTNAAGCDSVVTVTLTFNAPSTGDETYTGCEGDGYSVVVGATTYDEANPSGTETLTNAAGCDSVVTVTLTFNAPSTGDETYTGCEGDGYSVVVGATTYDESNPSGTETLTNAAGCDSVVTVTLTFNAPSTGDETYSGCEGDGYSVLVGATTYDESNPSGTETLTNAAGCDSVVTVTLTFNAASTGDETYSGCEGDGYSVLVGATTYDESNPSGTETLTNAAGCDSVVTVTLTFGANVTGSETYSGCEGDGYSVLVGNTTYDESNPSGTETLANAAGCDSVVTVTLTFNAPSTGDETYSGCEGDGYSVDVNGTTYDENNPTGIETIAGGAASGCDSTVTVTLTFGANATGTETYSGCEGDGYSVDVNGTTYDESNPTGIETIAGGAASGCDSTVTVTLTFGANATGTETYSGCEGDGYSVDVNGTTYDESNPSGTETIVGGAASGCDSTVTVTLTFGANATGTETYSGCEGDGYSVDVNGTTYDESNPSGTETIVGGAASGCDSTVTVTLTFNAPATLSAVPTDASCNGGVDGSIDLTATGTGPFTFAWSGGAAAVEDPSGLPAGSYSVTVTDGNGCTATTSTTVGEPAAIGLTATLSSFNGFNVSCNGATDGSISINASGGTGTPTGWTYNWSNGSNGNPLAGIGAGSYAVTVTDDNGCTAVLPGILLREPLPLACPIDGSSATTCTGGSSGEATVNPSGGAPNFTYIWSDGQTSATATGLDVGTFTVTVTDANGCGCTNSVSVSEQGGVGVTPDYISVNQQENNDAMGGPYHYNSHIITFEGGSAPYNFEWDYTGYVRWAIVAYPSDSGPGQINILYDDNAEWTVSISDDSGCSGPDGLVLTNDPAVAGSGSEILDIYNYEVVAVTNSTTPNGSITIDVEGGTPGYTYTWTSSVPGWVAPPANSPGTGSVDGGAGNQYTLTGLPTGWYTVIVTDSTQPTPQTTVGTYWVPQTGSGSTSGGFTRNKIAADEYTLFTATPNPFNEYTLIEFGLPETAEVDVVVYAPDGSKVKELYSGTLPSDKIVNVAFTADDMPAGMYIVRLTANNGVVMHQKVMLAR